MRNATVLLSLCFAAALAFAEPVETELEDVTVELLELRQHGNTLRLAVRFRNEGSATTSATSAIQFGDIVLLNPATKQKYFGIKDAEGRYLAGPVSDWNDGGRLWLQLAPGREAIVWMYFEAVASGTTLTVQLPFSFPFDDVPVAEGPRTYAAPAATVSSPSALKGSLIAARRANQELKVRVKLERATQDNADFAALEYRDAYVFDPIGKRKYPLLMDTDGQYLAQPKSDQGDGGRYFLNGVQASPAVMSLTFAAPPDDVSTVDVVLSWFVPFEAVQLSGAGGAAPSGMAAAGRAIGLEAALKQLEAQVTPQEIRIELAADVLFDFDKADLKPEATRALDNLLTVVKSRPNAAVTIEGHTDVRGDDAYNRALSQRRAEAVRSRLVAGGIPAPRLIAIGAGESRPVRTGDSEADHQANRRVEIRIREETSASSSVPGD